ncbi:DNA-3-methyladenine glycosylase I [Schleiferiaceae bacterium]|nr:DNA-3-methyladenine glycosylase I [Schleiferiaceae bacterium]
MATVLARCGWCRGSELYESYHDNEWGKPVHDERKMFEFLLLESFQAGLSWITVLKKREAFRAVFHQFDIVRVASMSETEIAVALENADIIRHEAKIRAAISNAQCVLELHARGTTLVDFFWSYVQGKPIINTWESLSEVPAKTELAEELARDLKKLGFKFVGATVIYAHMQATGMVNDHLISCPSHGLTGT